MRPVPRTPQSDAGRVRPALNQGQKLNDALTTETSRTPLSKVQGQTTATGSLTRSSQTRGSGQEPRRSPAEAPPTLSNRARERCRWTWSRAARPRPRSRPRKAGQTHPRHSPPPGGETPRGGCHIPGGARGPSAAGVASEPRGRAGLCSGRGRAFRPGFSEGSPLLGFTLEPRDHFTKVQDNFLLKNTLKTSGAKSNK